MRIRTRRCLWRGLGCASVYCGRYWRGEATWGKRTRNSDPWVHYIDLRVFGREWRVTW